jgi:hypothetical protein
MVSLWTEPGTGDLVYVSLEGRIHKFKYIGNADVPPIVKAKGVPLFDKAGIYCCRFSF